MRIFHLVYDSYTEPRIMQVKDGVAWSALEYMKWNRIKERETGSQPAPDAVVIPVGIVYTDKSKYRSAAVIESVPPHLRADVIVILRLLDLANLYQWTSSKLGSFPMTKPLRVLVQKASRNKSHLNFCL